MSAAATSTMSRLATISPPDLISYGSWEELANPTPAVCAVSPAYTDEYGSVQSFDEEHLRTLNIPSASTEENSENGTVQVAVSGTLFSVDKEVFSRLKKLPWESSADGSIHSLKTSPDSFEIVLNYLLFQTLPDVRSMSAGDKEELEALASQSGLTELASHATARTSFLQRRRSSTTCQKSDASISIAQAPDSPKSKANRTTSREKAHLPPVILSSFRNRRRTSSTASQMSEASVSSVANDAASVNESPKSSARKSFRTKSTVEELSSKDIIEPSPEESSAELNGASDIGPPPPVPSSPHSRSAGRKGIFVLPKRLSSKNRQGSLTNSQRQLNHRAVCASYADIIN
ncbi:hypothetical protein ACA910_011060 [Epithemia clementina (nom. ined.)]